MALINNTSIASKIQAAVNGGNINTDVILGLLNQALPASQKLTTATATTGIYKRFATFDIVDGVNEVVTTGLWSGDTGSLTSIFSSATQTGSTSGQYYYNAYDKAITDTTAEVQFAVTYGHKQGGGSVDLQTSDTALLASKATYAQYAALLLSSGSLFAFDNNGGTTTATNDIYAINMSRARYRESMDPGNWSINLSGSAGKFTFIDDSGKKFGDSYGLTGNIFKVVSGSLNLGTQNTASINTSYASNGQGFGLFYADKAIMVLNPAAIGITVGSGVGHNGVVGNLSGSLLTTTNQYNHELLFNAINKGGDFQARRTENVKTTHYFARVNNREFNYSNNPTFVTSNGFFAEPTFETDPQTFITTVGLYNDTNELIAVAKTSQPIVKSFNRETLIRIKLSF